MTFTDGLNYPRQTIFWYCEGSGKAEIMVPFSMEE
jgi:hypothetical protein